MSVVVETQVFTYEDYRSLDVDDNFIYELLNGRLVKKSAPNPRHQRISRNILRQLDSFVFNNQLGEVFYAPIDVFLDKYNAPQPDIVFVSKTKLKIFVENLEFSFIWQVQN